MRLWYKFVELRKEVREGRSFSPDEFAITLEQVMAGIPTRGAALTPTRYSTTTRCSRWAGAWRRAPAAARLHHASLMLRFGCRSRWR